VYNSILLTLLHAPGCLGEPCETPGMVQFNVNWRQKRHARWLGNCQHSVTPWMISHDGKERVQKLGHSSVMELGPKATGNRGGA